VNDAGSRLGRGGAGAAGVGDVVRRLGWRDRQGGRSGIGAGGRCLRLDLGRERSSPAPGLRRRPHRSAGDRHDSRRRARPHRRDLCRVVRRRAPAHGGGLARDRWPGNGRRLRRGAGRHADHHRGLHLNQRRHRPLRAPVRRQQLRRRTPGDRHFRRRRKQCRPSRQTGPRRGDQGRHRHQRPADPAGTPDPLGRRPPPPSRPLLPRRGHRRPRRLRHRRRRLHLVRLGDPRQTAEGNCGIIASAARTAPARPFTRQRRSAEFCQPRS
jgi:hypothetical protein